MRLAQLALPLVLLFCGWQQPAPTNAIYVTGDSVVWMEGTYDSPDGKTYEIERHRSKRFYVNADCHLRLKIESETKIEAQAFYEYRDVKEWLSTEKGTRIDFDIPAR